MNERAETHEVQGCRIMNCKTVVHDFYLEKQIQRHRGQMQPSSVGQFYPVRREQPVCIG